MITINFEVVGRGAFTIDQLRRYMLYPTDIQSAQAIQFSFDRPDNSPINSRPREYLLSMNVENHYSVPDVIARFASFGFIAKEIL
jgi:hypothetical protein